MTANINLSERILNTYSQIMELFFYVFLFGTLSFGRAFSVLYLDTPLSHLYVTEIFLLLNIPVLLYQHERLFKLPKAFLIALSLLFAYSVLHLGWGLWAHNMFALRDVVLSIYILFLPIAFIYFNNLKKLKLLIIIIFLSNIIGLVLGWCVIRKVYFSEAFHNFVFNGRLFNWGLYYGIVCSFIISFYGSLKSRRYKLIALLVLSVNLYMLIAMARASLWVAAIALAVFFYYILKGEFIKVIVFFLAVFVLVGSIMVIFDSKTARVVLNKTKGFKLFLQGVPYVYEKDPVEESPSAQALDNATIKKSPALGNFSWRLRIWEQTFQFAKDSPLLGKGFGAYPVYEIWGTHQYPKSVYSDSGIVPVHNHIITIFFKMGILGLVLFLAVNVLVFKYTLGYLKKCRLKFMKNYLIALLGSFIFWHSLALSFDVIDSSPTSIFLWIIIGLIFAAIEIDKDSGRQIVAQPGK